MDGFPRLGFSVMTLVPLPPIAPLRIPYCKPRRPDPIPAVACIKKALDRCVASRQVFGPDLRVWV